MAERPDLEGLRGRHKPTDPPNELGEQFCDWCEYGWPCETFVVASYALSLERQHAALLASQAATVQERDRARNLAVALENRVAEAEQKFSDCLGYQATLLQNRVIAESRSANLAHELGVATKARAILEFSNQILPPAICDQDRCVSCDARRYEGHWHGCRLAAALATPAPEPGLPTKRLHQGRTSALKTGPGESV